MTANTITTYTCDICGKMEHELRDPNSCWNPLRWAQVEWTEAPEEGKVHNQWKRLDLCPDHLNSFLKWMTEEQERRAQP